jgi:hypothetical protein
VLTELGNHVVEKWNSGRDIYYSGAINFEFNQNRGFFGGALNTGKSWIGHKVNYPLSPRVMATRLLP